MADNLFEDLKKVLDEFKTFLDDNVGTIRPAIATVVSFVPQVKELIDLLIDLMNKVKTEVQNLDVSTIQGLDEVSKFTGMIKGFLDSAQKLLPDESNTIDQIAAVADVVTGLPSLDAIKTEIIELIDAIVAHLNSLKS